MEILKKERAGAEEGALKGYAEKEWLPAVRHRNSNEAQDGITEGRRPAAMAPVPARELVSEAGDKANFPEAPTLGCLR